MYGLGNAVAIEKLPVFRGFLGWALEDLNL
jgi:hypothetical protein